MLLNFDTPPKLLTTKEHNEKYVACGAPLGVYVPNMSDEDMERWKGKHVTGKDERVEIRKTLNGVQLVIFVYKNPSEKIKSIPEHDTDEYRKFDWSSHWKAVHSWHSQIQISMNGKLQMSFSEYRQMMQVITEAIAVLGIELD